VVASPDEKRGNIVKAFVVLAAGHEPSDDLGRELGAFVRERHSAYAYPRAVEHLQNAIFRAVVLCDGELLTPEDFPQIRAQVGSIELSLHREARPGPVEFGHTPVSRVAAEPAGAIGAPPLFGTLRAIDDKGDMRSLADVEHEMIRLAIDHYHGQMSEVARRLGIGRSTLYRKLKEMGIDPDQERADRLAS
jgi:DNA-binding NtrC family response regulator